MFPSRFATYSLPPRLIQFQLLPTILSIKGTFLYISIRSAFFGFAPFIQRSPPGQLNNDGIGKCSIHHITTTTTGVARAPLP